MYPVKLWMLTVTLSLLPYHTGHKSRCKLALISIPTRNTVELISFTAHSCIYGPLAFPYTVFLGLKKTKSQEVATNIEFPIMHSDHIHTDASGSWCS